MNAIFNFNNIPIQSHSPNTVENNDVEEIRSRSSAFSENLNVNNLLLQPKEKVVDNFFRILNAFLNDPQVTRHIVTEFPGVIDRIPGRTNSNVIIGLSDSLKENVQNSKSYTYTKHIIRKLMRAVQDRAIDYNTVDMNRFFEEAFGLKQSQVEYKLNQLHPDEPIELRNGTLSQVYVQNPGRFFSYLKNYYIFGDEFLEWIRTTDELSDLVDVLSKRGIPITGNFAIISLAQFGNIVPPEDEIRSFADEYILIKETIRPPFLQLTTNFPIMDLKLFVEKIISTTTMKKLFKNGGVQRLSSGIIRVLNENEENRKLLDLALRQLPRTLSARSKVTDVRMNANTIRLARPTMTRAFRKQRKTRRFISHKNKNIV